jgi:hypothetical protein
MTMAGHGAVAPRSDTTSGGAFDRLANDVGASADRLRRQMVEVQACHGLGRRELAATQRAIRRLAGEGRAPTPNHYWETTAQPRAERLVRLGIAVIEEEMARLRGGVKPRRWSSHFVAERAPTTLDLTDAWVAQLQWALRATNQVDDLGAWWQRRLRRAALVRALPTLVTRTPGEAELVVSSAEMALLDQAPWAHGDRLLSAFELANRDLHHYATRRFTQVLQVRTPT